jgi:transposase
MIKDNVKKSTKSKPFLLIDNAKAHTANCSKQLAENYFRLLWLPPYSCRFNSIETLWANIKYLYSKQIPLPPELTQAELRTLILRLANSVKTNTIRNLVDANRAYLYATL